MKQPELGNLIASTRSHKNMTQEELAESCDVSVRTIQRIENGNVMPQAFTLRSITDTLELGLNEQGKPDHTLWIVLIHLSSVFLCLLVPIVMWAMNKHKDGFAVTHARKALNFQITMMIVLLSWCGILFLGGLISSLILGATGGIPFAIVMGVFTFIPPLAIIVITTYFPLRNCFRVLNDRDVSYPFSLRLF